MRSFSSLSLFSVLVLLLALSGCMKESASSNIDGSCKTGFVDAYNATVNSTRVVGELLARGSTSGAELSAALDHAHADCANLMNNYAGSGSCEAGRTGQAEDLKSNCDTVDALIKIQAANGAIDGAPATGLTSLEILR